MVMEVLAGGQGVAASVVLQAAVHGGQHLLQTLESVTHVPQQALALTLVLEKTNHV